MKNIKQIIALMMVSVIFTELLTGNMRLDQYLNPGIVLFVFGVAYGVPVFLIRELAVRWQVGFPSLLLLGFAYGIWNEGILAKTLLLNANVPVDFFNGYAGFLGINFPWMCTIVPWHAFFAVLTPIMLIHVFFRNDASTQWLSERAFRLITAILVMVGVTFYFLVNPTVLGATGSLSQLIAFFVILVLCVFMAYRYRAGFPIAIAEWNCSLKPLLHGVIFAPLIFILPAVLTGLGSGMLIMVVAMVLYFVTAACVIAKQWLALSALALFGMGIYVSQGVFTLIFHNDPVVHVTVIFLIGVVIVATLVLLRSLNKLGFFRCSR